MDLGNSKTALTENDKKMEWMYQKSTPIINREEYLLGRKIDKSFELLNAEEQAGKHETIGVKQPLNHVEHECIPFSIRSYRGTDSQEQVDLQRKVMEDPLMLIKQREMESRRRLLENPVKLKELHRILKTEEASTDNTGLKLKHKSKKSKSKKSKKKHKKCSKSSNESDSEDDLDRKLAKKYSKLKSLQNEHEIAIGRTLNKLCGAKYESISKELDKAEAISTFNSNRKSKRSNESASPPRRHRDEKTSYSQSNLKFKRHKSPRREERTLKMGSVKHMLTDHEKNRRFEEMRKNAEWRESDRATVVKEHRDAYEQEERKQRSLDFNKEFINKEVKKAISNQSSVSSRIRSNLNNIQRSSSSMNSNFTRK